MTEFEQKVRKIAQEIPYPTTPEFSKRADRSQMGHQIGIKKRVINYRYRQIAFGLLTFLILFAVTVMLVPEVRATVRNFFQIGTIEIDIDSSAVSTPTLVDLSSFPGRTSWDEAQKTVTPPIHLPVYPHNLGDPDVVFLSSDFAGLLTLYWDEEGIILQRLSGPIFGEKLRPQAADEVAVMGDQALWITGSHLLTLYDEQIGQISSLSRVVDGNVLIWTTGEDKAQLTWRLETQVELEEAIKIAESMEVP